MKLLGLSLLAGLFLSISASFSMGQSLAFSQVLKISAVEDTVPAGTVWKVCSFMQSRISYASASSIQNTACVNESYLSTFYVDGNYYHNVGQWGAASATAANEFPFWLPAGARLRTLCPEDFLSVIEFTVVP